jgi:hypothetical protein
MKLNHLGETKFSSCNPGPKTSIRTKKGCQVATNKSQRKTWGQPPREDELDHTDGPCSIYFYFMLMCVACNIRVLVGES